MHPAACVAWFWCGFSLQARRIRDIGWDPAVVIFPWILANVADKLMLVRLAPTLALFDGVMHGTYVGLLLNFVLSLVLLFWPSHDENEDDAIDARSGGADCGRASRVA